METLYKKTERPICEAAPEGWTLGRLAILKSVRRVYPDTPSVFGMGLGASDGKRVWYRNRDGLCEVMLIRSDGDWSGLIYTIAAHCVEPA